MRLLGSLFPPIPVQRRLFSYTHAAAIPKPRFNIQGTRKTQPDNYSKVLSPRDASICHRLLWALRNKLAGLPVRPDGFVPVSNILTFGSLRNLNLNLNYLRALIEAAGSLSGLELTEEATMDSYTPIWLLRAADWTKYVGVSSKAKHISASNMADLPFHHLLLRIPLEDWGSTRTHGYTVPKPHVVLDKTLMDHHGYGNGPTVVVIINVEMALRLGAHFYVHPDGTIRTTGDVTGFLDPQTFQQAHLVEWQEEILLADLAKPSLLEVEAPPKPYFRARAHVFNPVKEQTKVLPTLKRSSFVDKLVKTSHRLQKLSQPASHVWDPLVKEEESSTQESAQAAATTADRLPSSDKQQLASEPSSDDAKGYPQLRRPKKLKTSAAHG